MTDFAGALQKALYAKLTGVAGIPPVVSEVPTDDNGQPVYPFTLLGDDQITPIGAKGDPLEQHDAAIHVCMQSTTKLTVKQAQGAVKDALEDQKLSADGVSLSSPVLLSQDTPLLDDGATYVGTQIFRVFAQAAD